MTANAKEVVINYHITEKCNYACHYCFAKYDLEDLFKSELHHNLKSVNKLLTDVYHYFKKNNPTKEIRINFAGGEPLVLKKIPEILQMAYKIGYKVSLITNGSALTHHFINQNARYLSVIGVSIDSFKVKTNQAIGRATQTTKTLNPQKIIANLRLIKSINPGIFIKINTVVNEKNYNETMVTQINRIAPDKWKILEVLPNGKTGGQITTEQFDQFLSNNRCACATKFIEYKDDLLDSYIMINPLGQFYQRNGIMRGNFYSEQITKVGCELAFQQVSFNQNKFDKRYIPVSYD